MVRLASLACCPFFLIDRRVLHGVINASQTLQFSRTPFPFPFSSRMSLWHLRTYINNGASLCMRESKVSYEGGGGGAKNGIVKHRYVMFHTHILCKFFILTPFIHGKKKKNLSARGDSSGRLYRIPKNSPFFKKKNKISTVGKRHLPKTQEERKREGDIRRHQQKSPTFFQAWRNIPTKVEFVISVSYKRKRRTFLPYPIFFPEPFTPQHCISLFCNCSRERSLKKEREGETKTATYLMLPVINTASDREKQKNCCSLIRC